VAHVHVHLLAPGREGVRARFDRRELGRGGRELVPGLPPGETTVEETTHHLGIRVAAEREDGSLRTPVPAVVCHEVAALDARHALECSVVGATEPVIAVHEPAKHPRRLGARIVTLDKQAIEQPLALPLHLLLRILR